MILLADKTALDAPDGSPFKKEKWRTDLPTFSRFVISHDTDEFGKKAAKWTWRIQQRELSMLEVHITALVKSFDARAVAKETNHAVSFYPMFGGVRRQVKRMLRSAMKLWIASAKTPWPGADPDNLPIMSFKKTAN